ncbi:MAG: response regulator transcription factor [Chloroflexota bacterium]|nr:response regulator transcription factor [Chloroflexota bacterium]
MTRFSILLVERLREQGGESYGNSLAKRYDVTPVGSGKQALTQPTPAAIVLDAISLRTPGDRIAKQLKHDMPTVPLIHLRLAGKVDSLADVLLCPPFTSRKLINAIERLLRHDIADRPPDEVLMCGTLALNITRRLLIVEGQETSLTPQLAALVEAFFRHPDETLDRKWLMENVWKTDYMGDTRTLDVHVRWFRRAIEPDMQAPRYLKTVRGIGYRLEQPKP